MAVKGERKNEAEVAEFIRSRMKGFEYAGEYTGADGTCKVRCTTCGEITRRSMITIRHGKGICRNCMKLEAERKKAEREQRKAKLLQEKEEKRQRAITEKAKQLRLVICAVCGKPFLTTNGVVKTCSHKCSKEREKRIVNSAGSDDRLNRGNVVDKEITLAKLYERDGGRCQICGTACDYNDYEIRDGKVFVAGDKYPSIDHIIPLSKGGKHAWDNIRLVHRLCNTKEYWNNQRFAPSQVKIL